MCRNLSGLLVEVFGLPEVAVNSIQEVTSKALYLKLPPPFSISRLRTASPASPANGLAHLFFPWFGCQYSLFPPPLQHFPHP